MKAKINNTFAALVQSLALLAVLTPAVAGARNPVPKPYKTWQTEVITLDLRPQSQVIDEIGVYFPFTAEQFDARGTHLGNYVGTGVGRYYVFLWETMAPAAMVVASGSYVTANGDELDYAFFTADIEAGIESGVGTALGGTGRFADASGEFGYVVSTETVEWIPSDEPGADPATEGFFVISRTGLLVGSLIY